MPRILMTGAAGEIGTRLRKLLRPLYPDLVLSDVKTPPDLAGSETFKAADLANPAQVEAICEGVDGILHFGGFSVEGPWDNILQSNIIGCYNLFEAARKQGVKRVVFASSNHAVGFYPRHHRIGTDVTATKSTHDDDAVVRCLGDAHRDDLPRVSLDGARDHATPHAFGMGSPAGDTSFALSGR